MNQANRKTCSVLGLLVAGVCSVTGLASVPAMAAEGRWECKQVDQLKGVTPYGIFEILERYPNQFESVRREAAHQALAGLPVRTLSRVTISIDKCEWKGVTVCPAGDPRLTFTTENASEICWNDIDPDPNHVTTCIGSVTAMPYQDPCATHKLK